MRLFQNSASPFARKVLACAIARDIDGRIELIAADPHASPAELVAANPLSKIPALVTEDGQALFDSRVICEYLDSVGDAPAMFPAGLGPRWRALKQQALADGMMDAAVARRGDSLRPAEAARTALMQRQRLAVERGLGEFERDLPHTVLDIGSIALACALGYLDFRFAHEPWREAHPRLAAWSAAMGEQPALARTVPRQPA